MTSHTAIIQASWMRVAPRSYLRLYGRGHRIEFRNIELLPLDWVCGSAEAVRQ
jgi:hypothetical protein